MKLAEWLRRNRRTLGIPLVIIGLWLSHFDRRYLIPSLILVAFGEGLRIWAAGHLQKDKTLITGGPYRWIRNPLYLGSFLLAIGFCLVAGSIWVWILVAAYFVLCYAPVIRYEEGVLAEKFPDDYPAYANAVPGLYPGWKGYEKSSSRFSLQQVIKNKEYNAVFGILLAYLFLIFFR